MDQARMDQESFFQSIRERLVRALTLYCGDGAIAEEIAQDALERAFERWRTVSAKDSPERWVFKVAFNLAHSRFRSKAAERRARARLNPEPRADLVTDPALRVTVQRALSEIPRQQRAVLVLRFYLDLSVDDTAQTLGIASGTVKAHTHKALKRLREQSPTFREAWADE